jgi:hypothetical protein
MRTPIRFAVLFSLVLASPAYSVEKVAPQVPAISKGMNLTEALRILHSEEIPAEKLFRAVASRDPNKQIKEYLVYPEFHSTDALVIVADSPIGGKANYVVRSLQWHLNWSDDAKFPITLRGNKVLYLDSLRVGVLKDLPADVKNQRKNYKEPDPNDNPFAAE